MTDSKAKINKSCAKVYIQRDYTESASVVKFETKLPEDLRGKIDQTEFENILNTINSIYADAERFSATTIMENCFACLTAYLILFCMSTNYEKNIRKASEYINSENERLLIRKGLLMIDPMERGLRHIEICLINEPIKKLPKQVEIKANESTSKID